MKKASAEVMASGRLQGQYIAAIRSVPKTQRANKRRSRKKMDARSRLPRSKQIEKKEPPKASPLFSSAVSCRFPFLGYRFEGFLSDVCVSTLAASDRAWAGVGFTSPLRTFDASDATLLDDFSFLAIATSLPVVCNDDHLTLGLRLQQAIVLIHFFRDERPPSRPDFLHNLRG